MKALIVGAHGLLGTALVRAAPAGATVVAHGRATLDVTDRAAVAATVAAVRPDVVFNAAAYTAVDRAESDEAAALAVNATAVGALGEAARAAGARLVQVSTDFVFDGTTPRPYATDAAPAPLNAYGRTKLAGERAAGGEALIVRTAWLHGATGGGFVPTMLRLLGGDGPVRVVADQIGTPTAAVGLATALWALAARGTSGVLHYSCSGVASRYDLAVAVREEALALGLLRAAAEVLPIATDDRLTPAQRPACVVLDTRATQKLLGGPAPHWRVGLRATLGEMAGHG